MPPCLSHTELRIESTLPTEPHPQILVYIIVLLNLKFLFFLLIAGLCFGFVLFFSLKKRNNHCRSLGSKDLFYFFLYFLLLFFLS